MCLLCPFPIVKAISVRLQYFKDKTKQSRCLGNQKSPLVCSLSGEQGPSSSSSLDLPRPRPVCCPPGGACVCACVCGGEPPRTPAVRLSVRVCCPGQDGHSLEPWRPSGDRQDAVQEPPPPRPYRRTTPEHRGGSQRSERSLPGRWGQSRECRWAAETEAWEPQLSRGTQPCWA